MKLLVFSVLDKAVGAYLQPFYSRSAGEALRSFTDAANDEKSQFARHAEDYVLYKLGEFDDNTGFFHTGEPERIRSAFECMVQPSVTAEDAQKVRGLPRSSVPTVG